MNWNNKTINSLARRLGEARGPGYPPLTDQQLAAEASVSRASINRARRGEAGKEVQAKLASLLQSLEEFQAADKIAENA